MGECHFCKDLVSDDQTYVINAPNGQGTMDVCFDCMADILKFFKSGECEEVKLNGPRPSQGTLAMGKGSRYLYEVDKSGRPIRVFTNVRVEQMNYQHMPTNLYTILSGPQTNSPFIPQFKPVLEFHARIEDGPVVCDDRYEAPPPPSRWP